MYKIYMNCRKEDITFKKKIKIAFLPFMGLPRLFNFYASREVIFSKRGLWSFSSFWERFWAESLDLQVFRLNFICRIILVHWLGLNVFKNDVVSAFQKKLTTYVIRYTKFVNKIVHFNIFQYGITLNGIFIFSYLYITFILSLIYKVITK